MSVMDPCPTCGNLRRCIDRDRYSVVWWCGWCRTHAEEEFDPTPTNLLQREFGDHQP